MKMQLGAKCFQGYPLSYLFVKTCQSRIEGLKLKVDILCACSQIYVF